MKLDWIPRRLAGIGPLALLLALSPWSAALELQDAPTLAEARARLAAGEIEEATGMLELITAAHPDNGPAWRFLGDALRAQGEQERALQAYSEAMKSPLSAPAAHYNAACLHALRGDKERAFQHLFQAERSGAIDLTIMDADPDLASLREDGRFALLRPAPEVFADPFVEPVRILHELDGEAALGQFGWIARAIGDVDGDGASDFVTSAPTFGTWAKPAGRVYVYSSRSGKLLWQVTGEAGDQLGLGVEAAGDVDADGVPDVIAGAPGRSRAFVYSGRDGKLLLELAGRGNDSFGRKVSDAGDVDGDGHADLLVGAPQDSSKGAGAGACTLFSGQSGKPLLELFGERAGDRFGSAGAGWSDGTATWLAIGAPDAGEGQRGRVLVYDAHGAQRFAVDPDPSGAELGGMFVSIVGDVDGDGLRDVYASDWNDGALGSTTGRIYVHSGLDGKRLWSASGERAGDGFGIGPADAGDVDGDGHDDLIVGSWQHSSAAPSAGRVQILSGVDGKLLRVITCKVRGDTFGFDATGIGDIDGDGRIDYLLTSAWSAVRGTRSGRVFLIAG